MLATGTIKFNSLDEKTSQDTKLTRSVVCNHYDGDIEARSTFECLLYYPDRAAASFVGLEHLVGKLGGKVGGFILQHIGTFHGNKSETRLNVLAGSGTGELCGIKGHGIAVWSGISGDPSHVTLEYNFD